MDKPLAYYCTKQIKFKTWSTIFKVLLTYRKYNTVSTG